MTNQEYLKIAIEEGNSNSQNNFLDGGPFGAIIVKDGKIISKSHNTVLKSVDPTAHAEVNAIRAASLKLKTHNLQGCILYTSSEPCPMCLSAIIWANIKTVYYATSKEEVAKINFKDEDIYEYIKGNNNLLELHQLDLDEAKELLNKFKGNNNIY